MECGICQKHPSARRKFTCLSCTQASLYNPRIEQARALLSKEKSHTHIEAVLRPGNDGVIAALSEDADWDAITAGINLRSHERAKEERDALELRIEDIGAKAKELQDQINEHRSYIADCKQKSQQKRQAIQSYREELAARKSRALEPVQAAIKRATRHLEKTHKRTAEARDYLCKEFGQLCGLHYVKDRKGRPEYYLYGLPLPNLKDLNCINGRIRGEKAGRLAGQPVFEPHELISASLDNVCFFLAIFCHYLSVRLPAEVVLPFADFPHCALMQREASYRSGELRYPGIGSSSSSLSQSRMLSAGSERGKARVTQLDKPLLQLQKQDPKTYALFLEGAMLLGYDIAWLCRTQGVAEGTPSFDDVCDIGKNLFALVGTQSDSARPSIGHRVPSNTTKATTEANAHVGFGRYSHGSASNCIAGNKGLAMFAPDNWRVSPTMLTDKLKLYLRTEAAKSEWDIIEDTEWDDVLAHEQAVMVGGGSMLRRPLDGAKGPAMSVMTVAPHDGPEDSPAPNARGNNGWMKLRGRNEEGGSK